MMFNDPQQMREKIHSMAGGPVVVVFRKGGRITDERRCDSESDSLEDLRAIFQLIANYLGGVVGPDSIGVGFRGFLPWEADEYQRIGKEGIKPEEKLAYSSPIRVQDIVKNEQTGITTIYMESV